MALCLRFPRVSCARARAPKEMVSMSCSAWRDSSSESYFYCLSLADKISSSYLTASDSNLSVLAVEASSISLAELCSSEMSNGDSEAAPTSSSPSYFNGLIRLCKVSASGIVKLVMRTESGEWRKLISFREVMGSSRVLFKATGTTHSN